MSTPVRMIPFPDRPRAASADTTKATVWRLRLRDWITRHLPAVVRDADVTDAVSGTHLSIRVGPLFTRVTVNDRDFYFARRTGQFDGTGSSSNGAA